MRKAICCYLLLLLSPIFLSACGEVEAPQVIDDTAILSPSPVPTYPPFIENAPAEADDEPVDAGADSEEPASDTVAITNIQDYTIIYPQHSVGLEQTSALYLSEYIYAKRGVWLNVADDSSGTYDYEILIGDTNRAASQEAALLNYADNDLLIRADGEKIVLYGKGLMVAGAMGQFASRYVNGADDIEVTKTHNVVEYVQGDMRNAILMIGDGMGFAHVEFAKAGGLDTFKAEFLPSKGALLTECYPGEVTDSAAAGTALSSGYKTRYTYIGVDKDKIPRQNIRELAYDNGYKTAVVSTDTLSGATPASFLVHIDSRYKTSEINAQIAEVAEKEGDLLYIAGTENAPMLDDIKAALLHISTDSGRFFMMIEEDWIDYYAHYYERENLVRSVERFDESVAYVIAFAMAHPDTLLIVTADHETGGLIQQDDGTFAFTGDHEHTKTPVPIYAWGVGADIFNGKETENTEVARFLANAVFGVDGFGEAGG